MLGISGDISGSSFHVFGSADIGVQGVSPNGTGVSAISGTGHGVSASSDSGDGVLGVGKIGVHGRGGDLAGFFEGNANVTGNLTAHDVNAQAVNANERPDRCSKARHPDWHRKQPTPARLAEKTIEYAKAKTVYCQALRAAMPEMINIATRRLARPLKVDEIAAIFSFVGERQETIADRGTLFLLKRFSGNPCC